MSQRGVNYEKTVVCVAIIYFPISDVRENNKSQNIFSQASIIIIIFFILSYFSFQDF